MDERVKIRVDAPAGVVEAEGSEAFVREMLDRFARVLTGSATPHAAKSARRGKGGKTRTSPKETKQPTGKAKSGRPKRPEVNEDLRRRLDDYVPQLSGYVDERKISSQMEEVAVIARFLGSELGLETVDETDYVTVLKTMGRRLPKNPRQTLLDAENRKQFFYREGEEGAPFRLTSQGIKFADERSLKVETGNGG